ncbi:MAG: BTAD domain-containing putative transcriptional regulator, partial [Chloroflexota bacterium]
VQALLSFLILMHHQPHSREALIDALWPELPPDKGRKSLTDTLYRLTRSLPLPIIVATHQTISIDKGMLERQQVDVWRFDELIQKEQLVTAELLYKGEIVPDIYADWIWFHRETYRQKYLQLCLKLAAQAEAAFSWGQASRYFQNLIHYDPLDEKGVRGLMRTLAAQNRSREALYAYEKLVRFLDTELQTSPEPQTEDLAASIRSAEPSNRPHVLSTGAQSATHWGTDPSEEGEISLPFLGRQAIRSALLRVMDDAIKGRTAGAFLDGEAGIGKSRLIQELRSNLRWRRAEIIEISLPASITQLDELLSPLIAALLPPERAAQMEMLLSRPQRHLLSQYYPRWQPAFENEPPIPFIGPEAGEQRIAFALYALLRSLSMIKPHIIVFDDFHHCGPFVYRLFSLLLPRLRDLPLTFLISQRPILSHGDHFTSIEESIQKLEIAQIVSRFHLDGLTKEEIGTLPQNHQLRARFSLEEMVQLCGGNPFYLTQIYLAADTQDGVTHTPYAELILERFERLVPNSRQILQAASVLEPPFLLPIWTEVSGLSAIDLFKSLEEVEQASFIESTPRGYRFTHALLQQTLYESIAAEIRQAFHIRAAAFLEEEESRSDRPIAKELAHHLAAGGQPLKAAAFNLKAGESARQKEQFDTALAHYLDAEGQFQQAGQHLPFDTLLNTIQVQQRLGQYDAAQEHINHFKALNKRDGQPISDSQEIKLHLFAGRNQSHTGQYHPSVASLDAGIELADAHEEEALLTELLLEKGDVMLRYATPNEAIALFQNATKIARLIGRIDLLGTAFDGLAFAKGNAQHPSDDVIALFEEAIACQIEAGDRFNQARTLTTYIGALQNGGYFQRALDLAVEAEVMLEAIGYRRGLGILRQSQGLISQQMGMLAEAHQYFEEAVSLFESVNEQVGRTIARQAFADVLKSQGLIAEAKQTYERAIEESRALQSNLLLGYSLLYYGFLLLSTHEPESAIQAFEESIRMWDARGEELNAIRAKTGIGLANLQLGDHDGAGAILDLSLEKWGSKAAGGENLQHWYWDLYQLLIALRPEEGHLKQELIQAAYEEVARLCHSLETYRDQRRLIEAVPVNHQIVRTYDQLFSVIRQQSVSLAKQSVPLGKSLAPSDYVNISWTIHAPADDAAASKASRRRAQIRRLTYEAAEQGASPSDQEIAHALGVSRRTVLRDIKELEAAGHTILTRGRAA